MAYPKQPVKKCIRGCGRTALKRGLCRWCYVSTQAKVKAGKTTWDIEESAGRSVPRSNKGLQGVDDRELYKRLNERGIPSYLQPHQEVEDPVLECKYGCQNENRDALCKHCNHVKHEHLMVHPHHCITESVCMCPGFEPTEPKHEEAIIYALTDDILANGDGRIDQGPNSSECS